MHSAYALAWCESGAGGALKTDAVKLGGGGAGASTENLELIPENGMELGGGEASGSAGGAAIAEPECGCVRWPCCVCSADIILALSAAAADSSQRKDCHGRAGVGAPWKPMCHCTSYQPSAASTDVGRW